MLRMGGAAPDAPHAVGTVIAWPVIDICRGVAPELDRILPP